MTYGTNGKMMKKSRSQGRTRQLLASDSKCKRKLKKLYGLKV